MIKLLFSICLLAIAACGRPEIDPEFAPFVAEFEAQAKARGLSLFVGASIQFGIPEGQHVQGFCINRIFSRSIYIDRASWDAKAWRPAEQKALIMHELGHCEVGRMHAEPDHRSLMQPNASSATRWLEDDPSEMFDELFSPLVAQANLNGGLIR